MHLYCTHIEFIRIGGDSMGKESGAVNWKRVLILAGAVIAFTIGSGFATGQEIISILQPMAGSPFWLFLDLRLHFCITISTLQKQVRSSILNMGTTCTNISAENT